MSKNNLRSTGERPRSYRRGRRLRKTGPGSTTPATEQTPDKVVAAVADCGKPDRGQRPRLQSKHQAKL